MKIRSKMVVMNTAYALLKHIPHNSPNVSHYFMPFCACVHGYPFPMLQATPAHFSRHQKTFPCPALAHTTITKSRSASCLTELYHLIS